MNKILKGDDMNKSSHIITFKDSQEHCWNEFRDQFLEDYIENLLSNYDDQDKDEQKRIRSKANTYFANFISKNLESFITECKVKKEIWNKDRYPDKFGWIKYDLEIQNKLKKYTKLLDIIHFIDNESCLVKSNDNKFAKVQKNSPNEKRQISYFIVSKIFYEKAISEIGIAQITIQKTIQELCKIGILKQIKKYKLPSKAMVYSDGYYHKTKVGLKKEHWMTKEKHQKALRNFSYGN
jgi:hypothetical protein